MNYTAKLNKKFYILTFLFFGLILFVLYGIWFLNTNSILMDGIPMSEKTKLIFTIILSSVVFSWIISLISLLHQIILGYAFKLNDTGIHMTVTGIIIFAFIFVVPIKLIPYSAINEIKEKDDIIILNVDKKQIKSYPFLQLFIKKEYMFLEGFANTNKNEIKKSISLYTDSSK